MENWKVIAVAAGVGLASVASIAVAGADRAGVAASVLASGQASGGSSGVTSFTASMNQFCTTLKTNSTAGTAPRTTSLNACNR